MRFYLLLIIFLLCQLVCFGTVDIEKAKYIAETSFGNKYSISIAEVSNNFVVFSRGNNDGYIIVGINSYGQLKILGYSDYGNWNTKDLPPYLTQWIDCFNRYTSHKNLTDEKGKSHTRSSNSRVSIPILLNSKWHQNSPYNDLSPIVLDGNIKSLAGCVAIAASQIVNYWKLDNPDSTYYDTPTYNYGMAPVTYSVPAGTEYRWNLIRNEYLGDEREEEKESVATLVYIVGTSAWLQYSATGTGGHINDVIKSFSSQFHLNGKYYIKNKYSQDDWEQLLYDNLLMSQPILYGGSSEYGGHAVVIDGYDANLNLFHFNFGWGGGGDGYYTVDDITGMNGYLNSQSCVCDIYPMKRNISVTQELPNIIEKDTITTFSLKLINNSTLSIQKLHYFLKKELNTDINNKDTAVLSIDQEIINDGRVYDINVSLHPKVSVGKYNLVLTDENMRILKQEEVRIGYPLFIKKVGIDDSNNIKIQKSSDNTLCIETNRSTKVTIYSVDGKNVFSDYIDGKYYLFLPHGIYIIGKKKWLQ